jgi:hypothetical protein
MLGFVRSGDGVPGGSGRETRGAKREGEREPQNQTKQNENGLRVKLNEMKCCIVVFDPVL